MRACMRSCVCVCVQVTAPCVCVCVVCGVGGGLNPAPAHARRNAVPSIGPTCTLRLHLRLHTNTRAVRCTTHGACDNTCVAPHTSSSPRAHATHAPAAAKLQFPSGLARSSIMAVQSTQVKAQSSAPHPRSAAMRRHRSIWKPSKWAGSSRSAQRTCVRARRGCGCLRAGCCVCWQCALRAGGTRSAPRTRSEGSACATAATAAPSPPLPLPPPPPHHNTHSDTLTNGAQSLVQTL
jgi:hypothetical protein